MKAIQTTPRHDSQLYRPAAHALELLGRQVRRLEPAECDFASVLMLIEALPLDGNLFRAVVGHLRNAARYCRRGERGAASYELKLVGRILARWNRAAHRFESRRFGSSRRDEV